eukprot:COSAG02_NODE_1361_length_13053_cov_26.443956_8_plen_88_part_00
MHHTLADLVHHQPSLLPGAGARQPSLLLAWTSQNCVRHWSGGGVRVKMMRTYMAYMKRTETSAPALVDLVHHQPSLLPGAGARQLSR